MLAAIECIALTGLSCHPIDRSIQEVAHGSQRGHLRLDRRPSAGFSLMLGFGARSCLRRGSTGGRRTEQGGRSLR